MVTCLNWVKSQKIIKMGQNGWGGIEYRIDWGRLRYRVELSREEH